MFGTESDAPVVPWMTPKTTPRIAPRAMDMSGIAASSQMPAVCGEPTSPQLVHGARRRGSGARRWVCDVAERPGIGDDLGGGRVPVLLLGRGRLGRQRGETGWIGTIG